MTYRYRLISEWLGYDKVLVQQKTWYDWRTIARFYRQFNGVKEAQRFIAELKEGVK